MSNDQRGAEATSLPSLHHRFKQGNCPPLPSIPSPILGEDLLNLCLGWRKGCDGNRPDKPEPPVLDDAKGRG
jgi:hypothetical protein